MTAISGNPSTRTPAAAFVGEEPSSQRAAIGWGALIAAFFAVLPLVLAFHFLQKYWTSGLAAGSVKG